MDKWKDKELQKMKVGGNKKAKEFFESQPDYNPNWSIHDKYNSRAAALLRDKVNTEAEGNKWSFEKSSAKDYKPSGMTSSIHTMSSSKPLKSEFDVQKSYFGDRSGGYEGGFQNSDTGNYNSGGSDPRYQGFGNPQYQGQSNMDQNDLLTGAMSSLSMGWNYLSKGAATAAVVTKDFASQAGAKAAELSGTMTEKVNEGGFLGGFGSIAAKATDGFSSFVKSPSLQGFTGAFKAGQYDDLGTPEGSKQSSASLSNQCRGDFDNYNATGDNLSVAAENSSRKKSPTNKKPRSKNSSQGDDDLPTRKPKKKPSPSPQPPEIEEDNDDMMFFDAPKTRAAREKLEKEKKEKEKQAAAQKQKVDDDADAWALLNS